MNGIEQYSYDKKYNIAILPNDILINSSQLWILQEVWFQVHPPHVCRAVGGGLIYDLVKSYVLQYFLFY